MKRTVSEVKRDAYVHQRPHFTHIMKSEVVDLLSKVIVFLDDCACSVP